MSRFEILFFRWLLGLAPVSSSAMSTVVARVSPLAPLSAVIDSALSCRLLPVLLDFTGLSPLLFKAGSCGETLLPLVSLLKRLGALRLEFESGLVLRVSVISDSNLILEPLGLLSRRGGGYEEPIVFISTSIWVSSLDILSLRADTSFFMSYFMSSNVSSSSLWLTLSLLCCVDNGLWWSCVSCSSPSGMVLDAFISDSGVPPALPLDTGSDLPLAINLPHLLLDFSCGFPVLALVTLIMGTAFSESFSPTKKEQRSISLTTSQFRSALRNRQL